MGERAIGEVEAIWRYPVKSMAGEALPQVFVGHGGVYGDRIYALIEPGGRASFPWLTARERPAMLLHRPVFRHPERAVEPPNWAAAQGPGMTPIFGDIDDLVVEVETPAGTWVLLDAEDAVDRLRQTLPELPEVVLRRSERALTDCGPVSLVDQNFVEDVARRLGREVDVRAFRANLYLRLEPDMRLDDLAGRQLRLGDRLRLLLLERQGRCVLLTLDPDGGPAQPDLLRDVARENEGTAGVLAVVVREGVVAAGDAVWLQEQTS